MPRPRLLILVVASNASRTLAGVLDRIPRTLDRSSTRVLVVDDASGDRTFEVGDGYRSRAAGIDLEVPTNPDPIGYPSSHTLATAEVPDGARVLDVGCRRGLLGAELQRRGCRVHGLDRGDAGLPEGLARFDRVDLDADKPPLEETGYDVVLLLDIVEHLKSPEAFLAGLRERLGATGPKVVLTAPNVAFAPLRLRLLLGGFEYGREGILDLTHTRLFTIRSLVRLLRRSGYRIERVGGIPAPFPKALGDGLVARALLGLNAALIRLSRGLFSYQSLVIARPRPTVAHLLARNRDAAASRREAAG